MPKFRFKLQKVLDFRQTLEEQAKDAFLAARLAKKAAVGELERIELRRGSLLRLPLATLEDRISMEGCLEKLDGEERRQRIVIEELEQEEELRRAEWTERRKELKTLEKLREKARQEWIVEENRKEQGELDEWTSTRRAA